MGLDFLMSTLKGREKRIFVRLLVAALAFFVIMLAVFLGVDEYGQEMSRALVIGAAAGLVGMIIIAVALLLPFLPARARRYQAVVPLVGILFLGLVVVEYWNPPTKVSPLATPEFIRNIAKEPGDFVVVDAPVGRRTGFTYTGNDTGGPLANYYQHLYEKATPGGYVSRVKDEGFPWIHDQPGLRLLSCPHCPELPSPEDLDRQKVRAFFLENKIKYVVLHKRDPRGQGISFIGEAELTKMDSYLRDVVRMTEVYKDEIVTVYLNPAVDDAESGAQAARPGQP
jgi:hypothetical protein